MPCLRQDSTIREPTKWFVRVSKREKRSCGKCSAIQMPPLAPRIVEKGLASDRVVIETVVAKYCDHLPLYRQGAMLEREAGVEISRGTLDGWVMRVGELLQPLVGAMRADLLRSSYIQADETIVPVQMHDNRGADHPAYLWQYGTPGGETVFDFQLSRGRDGPRKFLKDWNGILQTDGYQAYAQVGGAGLIHVGCWAHARRKFVDAVKVNPKDGAAIAMVTRMDALFLVDREARQQQLNVEDRSALRREHAHPWVDEIHSECGKLRAQLLPKSALGEAVHYTLNMWAKLRRCFDHAEVELSNNLAENSMRPVALGRKNWLHVGSAKAGPKVAAILSIRALHWCRIRSRAFPRRSAGSWLGRRLLLRHAADSLVKASGPDEACARAVAPPVSARDAIPLPLPRALRLAHRRPATPVADRSAFRCPARETRCAVCAAVPGATESRRPSSES